MKILVVGGGITSSLTGMFLRKMLPDCNLTLWDKAKGSGGRMTTSKCPINASCTADIGAQYITTSESKMKSNCDVYEELISESVLEPLKCKLIGFKTQGESINFIAPNGTGLLVKHFINKAKFNDVKFSHHVHSINREADKWIVETKSGEKDYFNAVILTMPAPQVFLLEGTFQNLLSKEISNNLKAVKYSSRYVLILYFLDNLREDWGAQFIDNNEVFRYVAIDNVKRNKPESLCAAVFHTSVGFGEEYVESAIPEVEKVLLSQAKSLFPAWPEPKSVKCHKWRYSQVTNSYHGSPGCVVVSTNPPILIGGDSFTGSGFDNCVKSSKVMCEKINNILKGTLLAY